MKIAYDGTEFCGWQIQRGKGKHRNPKPSIEGSLNRALFDLSGQTVHVTGSGRTDAGVHANGQIAHFDLDTSEVSCRPENLLGGLNDRLPTDLRILALEAVGSDFSAKKAIRKQYSYYYLQGPSDLPHLSRYSVWNRRELSVEAMSRAAHTLLGEHDFSAFCGAGAQVSSTIRELYEVDVTRECIPMPGSTVGEEYSLIRIRMMGSGFLKYMARRICGTLRRVGEGRLSPDSFTGILESKDNERSGPTAAPCGLWMDRVWFPPEYGISFLAAE